ncbi:flagellar protein [Paenibacillus doosanensis]|uniref:flagellar protein n=1 Tax=Paenibacillus doosanensis TaxID=1229154 RepID=UPI0021808772|nr:flagellar protein [Paenibacillus doosanensis]
MSILAVANCPGCGRVFQRNLRNLCMDCISTIDNEFDSCYRYMLHNRKASTGELSRATGVSVQRLTGWIRDKRLSTSDFPNLTYPCNSCSSPIREHRLCVSCSTNLTKEIRGLKWLDERKTVQGVGFHSFR